VKLAQLKKGITLGPIERGSEHKRMSAMLCSQLPCPFASR
jgi:hypothetical protein